MKLRYLLIILTSFWFCGVHAQQADDISLNTFLQQWSDGTGMQYAGKTELLEKCSVTVVPFQSLTPEKLDVLITPCALSVKQVGNVLIIRERSNLNTIDGFVKDENTHKPIAYAAVQTESHGTTTDEDGYFFVTTTEPEVNIKISHLGYEPKELKCSTTMETSVFLSRKTVSLEEVRVTDKSGAVAFGNKQSILITERTIDAGFYRSLKEVLADSSFQSIRTPIKPIFRNHGVVYHRIRLPKEERKKIGNVFGFSDGQFVYINPRTPKPRRLTDFYHAERIGPYLYFKEEVQIRPSSKAITWLAERLVDIETGKTFTLTRSRLREIISDDAELLELFNAEKGKSGKLKLYLLEYLRRNSGLCEE